ncbi:hypothetical protein JST56_06160 [Candidatus Dependentiae bacterium]|jgi:hypothetical protein|nr:hypothetical protein [Candidatus Dependentiae bacterium]
MKKLLLIILALAFLSSNVKAATSKTFFMPRSMHTDNLITGAQTNHFIAHNKKADRFLLDATLFYQESTNGKDLARYILPENKTEITIKGSTAGGDAPDISGTWLQIGGKDATTPLEELFFNSFSSKVSIRPELKRFGSTFYLYKALSSICKSLWFDATFPFVQVETNLNLKEFDVQNAAENRGNIEKFILSDLGGDPARIEQATMYTMLNATEGLNNPSWNYGKFSNGVQKLAGLADITLKLGYYPIKKNSYFLNMYSQLIIPTGYKPTIKNVFEPIVGNGKHVGLGAGFAGEIQFFKDACWEASFSSNFDYAYLLENRQRRSFDLISNGEFSRYLLVFAPNIGKDTDHRTPTPGINIFSEIMKVTPQSEINWTNQLNLSCNNINFNIGYNLWWKDKEQVKLAHEWNKEVAIEHFSTQADFPFRLESFSQASIKQSINQAGASDGLVGDNPIIKLVSKDNLNLNSASFPGAIGHTIFGSIGYATDWKKQPINLNFGSSYQVNSSKKVMQDWKIWLECSLNI